MIKKFRVWDKAENEFCDLSEYKDSAKWFDRHVGSEWSVPKSLIIQQFTGLKDKKGKDTFEGDKIKFIFKVGDFAWEFMEEEDEKRNSELNGKEFFGVVTWNETCAGFEILVGEPGSTHLIFPAMCVKDGEIIGNIFEG